MIKGLLKQVKEVNEYERTPVPQSSWKGLRNFIGMYAGEHTAGTEFVIGPLFVAHGVSAVDLLLGLLVGNFLAVLSWTFLCAPIAVKERVTLYYKLEKICGRHLATIYNIVNGAMFCGLAGAMIAVSATAVGIPFGMTMPELNDLYPNSIGWVLAVLAVGVVITVVAVLGYDKISKFANIAAPWMILVFIAAAVAVLPDLGVSSFSDFWEAANTRIWTGVPLPGQSKFTFWHVMFFAWFANMAMHIGMSDLSVFRYAKKWEYGFASATGMFLGHYVAWVAAGVLYSVVLVAVVPQGVAVAEYLGTATDVPSPAPGPLAYNAAGIAGALCVIIAGWTTANPTIYRAGLAFQGINPKWKTWKVTLITGLVTSILACFPALVMKLLDFVALYGLILMPMGAVIFIDFYIVPKLGLRTDYAAQTGKSFFWAPAITWALTLAICVVLNMAVGVEIFFLGLPGWIIAAALYIISSKVLQKKVF